MSTLHVMTAFREIFVFLQRLSCEFKGGGLAERRLIPHRRDGLIVGVWKNVCGAYLWESDEEGRDRVGHQFLSRSRSRANSWLTLDLHAMEVQRGVEAGRPPILGTRHPRCQECQVGAWRGQEACERGVGGDGGRMEGALKRGE